MTSNNWKTELNRMLDSFANQAESSLEKINQEFKAMGRSLDEDFRQYFLKVSNLRLDSSYTKIALNQWDECQIENRVHPTHGPNGRQVEANPGTLMDGNENNNHQMKSSDLVTAVENDDVPLMVIKNENRNDFIEIIDSDEERDLVQSDRQESTAQNEETVDENGLNALMQDNNGEDVEADENAVKEEPDASIKSEIMDAQLPLVTFDPNNNSGASSSETGDIVLTPQNGQSSKTRKSRPSTKQNQNKMKRSDGKRLKCKQCDYATNHKGNLKTHQKVHAIEKSMGVARDSNNLYQCTHCVRQFTKLENISRHMKASHKNDHYLYDCARCMRQFLRKAEKDRHECRCDGHHYECHLCKTFVTKDKCDMQKHMRTHSGDKPYRCMVCDKSFRQESHLKYHLDAIHG